VERHWQRLQWSDLRHDFGEWAVHCALHCTDPVSSVGNCDFRGRSHKIRQRFGDDSPAGFRDGCSADSAGEHRKSAAIYGNSDQHNKHCHNVERHWQRLQWSDLRHDFGEWALHCAIRCTDPVSSVGNCDFRGRSHKIRQRYGDDYPAGFCNGCTADCAAEHWKAAAVRGNCDQHNEHCRNVERHWQRMQWSDLRHDLGEWALHRTIRCTDPVSSVGDCDFGGRSHKIRQRYCDDYPAGFCNGCTADSASEHWKAAAVRGNRDQHNKHCRNVERHRQRLQWSDLRDDLSEWALHRAIRCTDPVSSVGDCDFCGRSNQIRQRFGDDSPAGFCNSCTADRTGSYRSTAAVHGNSGQHNKHRRNVERHRQRLQRSDLRDDFGEWALHCAIRCTDSGSGVGDCDFRGRSHKIRQRFGDDSPACFSNRCTADSAGSHWSTAAVHGNRGQHNKHRRNVERHRQRLQWSDLRHDLVEWALHCAIHRTNSASSVGDCDFRGRSHKIRQRFGDDSPAGFCNGCAADIAGSHRSAAAVHGNCNRHNKHRRNVEHHGQRLQWSNLRHDFGEWALHRAVHRTNPSSSVGDCDFSGRSHKIRKRRGDDYPAGFSDGCAADRSGSHWSAAAVHGNRGQHDKHRRNLERHRQRLQRGDLRHDLREWALHCALDCTDPVSSVRNCDFRGRSHKIRQRFSDDSPACFCNGCSANSAGSNWSSAAVHGNCNRHDKHRRIVEHHGQRLQWSDLRHDLSEWALHCSIHRTNSASSIRDRDFRGGCHKVRHRYGDDHPAGFCYGCSADSAGSVWSPAAVHPNGDRHNKHRRIVERLRERLHWSGLRDDLSEWALHCAVHRPDSKPGKDNRYLRCRSNQGRQRYGEHHPGNLSQYRTAWCPGDNRRQSAVLGNCDRHNENCRILERLGQRLHWSKLRHYIS
jgi:hypothetical protein